MQTLFELVDHLVYVTPEVKATTQEIATRFGVVPAVGGRHPAWATMNTLLALGPRVYLEIMGPDPGQEGPKETRPFGIDRLTGPRLASWVVRSRDLPKVVKDARAAGADLGEVQERSRTRPDGTLLRWSMTDLMKDREGGALPYFIDWGGSPHPAQSAPQGCAFRGLTVTHPDAQRVTRILGTLGIDLVVTPGPKVRISAAIQTPRGLFELA